MFGRVVLALSNIPCEVCEDQLTDVKHQATNLSQLRSLADAPKRYEYMPTDWGQGRCVGIRVGCRRLDGREGAPRI